MKTFKIQTLSDRVPRLADPVTIISGGVAVIQSLFPNIFGGTRRRLNDQDWITLIPGNGYWTTALRSYLKRTIRYDTDLKNIEPFTRYFVYENKQQLGLGNYPNNTSIMPPFYEILNKERLTGGSSPVVNVPTFISGAGFHFRQNGF